MNWQKLSELLSKVKPPHIIILIILLILALFFGVELPTTPENPNKEFSIVVRDEDTEQPIEDASIQWIYCEVPGDSSTDDNGYAFVRLIKDCPSRMNVTITKNDYKTHDVTYSLRTIEGGELKIINLKKK